MHTSLLKSVYSSGNFRKRGHELIDQLADYFETSLNEKSDKVIVSEG